MGARPLDAVYAAIFIDAIVVKVRDGQVANRPVYAAIGVTWTAARTSWACGPATGGEGARFWMSVLTDLKNRGVRDVFFVVCDGLKGLPERGNSACPQAIVQTCIIHLIRNTFRLRLPEGLGRDQAATSNRSTPPPTRTRRVGGVRRAGEKWGDRYPAIIRLWGNAWEEFIPFLDYDVEIRKVLCSTNAIESLNARYRRAVRARGHFPNEQAA